MLRAGSRSLILVLLVSSFLSLNDTRISRLSTKSVFLALRLDSKVFPSRNMGPRRNSCCSSIPPCLKLRAALYMSRVGMTALSLMVLCGDVNPNPGPPSIVGPEIECHVGTNHSFSSISSADSEDEDSESLSSMNSSFAHNDDSDGEYCDPSSYYDIGLGSKGLRFGTWNVNRLTSTKFEEIKLYLLDSNGRPRIDILS